MRQIIVGLILIGVAELSFGEHTPKSAGRQVAPRVSVCTVQDIHTEGIKALLKTAPVVCTAGNRKVALTEDLLKRIKGQVYLVGDPCHTPDPDAPPSDPGTGFDELLAAACTIELEGARTSKLTIGNEVISEAGPSFGSVMDGLKVDPGIVEKLSFGNVFTPHSCVSRRIHK